MKLVFASSLLVAIATAQNDTETPPPIDPRSIKSSSKMLSYLEVQSFSNLQNFKHKLNNYGCYCFVTLNGIDSSHVGGQGAALDEADAICRDLALAYSCIERDSMEGAYVRACNTYGSFSWYGDNGEIVCGKDDGGAWGNGNKNACKMDLCRAEKYFADRMIALFNNGFDTDLSNYGANAAGMCAKINGNGGGSGEAGQCCGAHPTRKPAPNGDTIECCGDMGHTFNTVTHECCASGEVHAQGSC